jgi:hypothetical protein
MSAAAAIRKAKSTDNAKLIAAMAGLAVETPFGPIRYRAIDHQSTMGAYVGRLAIKDGKGVMVDARYADGADYLPSDDWVRAPPGQLTPTSFLTLSALLVQLFNGLAGASSLFLVAAGLSLIFGVTRSSTSRTAR